MKFKIYLLLTALCVSQSSYAMKRSHEEEVQVVPVVCPELHKDPLQRVFNFLPIYCSQVSFVCKHWAITAANSESFKDLYIFLLELKNCGEKIAENFEDQDLDVASIMKHLRIAFNQVWAAQKNEQQKNDFKKSLSHFLLLNRSQLAQCSMRPTDMVPFVKTVKGKQLIEAQREYDNGLKKNLAKIMLHRIQWDKFQRGAESIVQDYTFEDNIKQDKLWVVLPTKTLCKYIRGHGYDAQIISEVCQRGQARKIANLAECNNRVALKELFSMGFTIRYTPESLKACLKNPKKLYKETMDYTADLDCSACLDAYFALSFSEDFLSADKFFAAFLEKPESQGVIHLHEYPLIKFLEERKEWAKSLEFRKRLIDMIASGRLVPAEVLETGPFFYLETAELQLNLNKPDDGIHEIVKKALELGPRDVYALMRSGMIYTRIGAFKDAAIQFSKALEIDPLQGDTRDLNFLSNIAYAYAKVGNTDKASYWFKHFIDAFKDQPLYLLEVKSDFWELAHEALVSTAQQFYIDFAQERLNQNR